MRITAGYIGDRVHKSGRHTIVGQSEVFKARLDSNIGFEGANACLELRAEEAVQNPELRVLEASNRAQGGAAVGHEVAFEVIRHRAFQLHVPPEVEAELGAGTPEVLVVQVVES